MNLPTLRQLQYLKLLAEHGSFGRAAEAAHVTQPTLSAGVQELEKILGGPVVDRARSGVILTAIGEVALGKATTILNEAEELVQSARNAGQPLTGRFRLGVIPTVAPYLLPRLMQDLAAEFPALDLRLRETITGNLIEDLLDGRLDAAIVALPVFEPALHEEPLFDEEFVLVRPAAEAGRPVPGAEGLRQMRLLLLEEGHCFRDQALSFCKLGPAGPRELMEGSSLATLVQMVGAGIGVTLIPEMAVPVETRSANVALARLPAPRPTRTIGMVWRKTSPLAAQMHDIARLLPRGPARQEPG